MEIRNVDIPVLKTLYINYGKNAEFAIKFKFKVKQPVT